MVRRSCVLLAACLACASPGASSAPETGTQAPARADEEPSGDAVPLDAGGTYLRANVADADGTPAYVHVAEADMPLRVAVGLPKSSPRLGSREDARQAAIEGMQLWETALQPHLPWFALEFVEEDEDAPVQIVWKRRITGPYAGFGRLRYWVADGRLSVGGEMQLSTQPGNYSHLKVDDVRLLVAHEFGHVLGLGHCHECDSAMSYAWHTRERVVVTETDVRTFLALVSQPNGQRIDGRRLSYLEPVPP